MITTSVAQDLIGLDGTLYAYFSNEGIYKYTGGAWTKISDIAPNIIDADDG